MDGINHLRVLVANQSQDRLDRLTKMVNGLGHKVVGSETHVTDVAALTARLRPDVALVGLGESSEHALKLISEIVSESFCPVIALLRSFDGPWINDAAELGIYGYIVDTDPDELQSALDITLRRYAEHAALKGAFDLRAERALAAQKQLLILHDGVMQSLTASQLALDRDEHGSSRVSLLAAMDTTRALVADLLADLQEQGLPLEELIRASAPATP